MYCKHCGKEIDNNALICPGCGIATDNYNKSVPVTTQKNTIALVGFILSFFSVVVGLILSIIGYVNSKKPEYAGDGKNFAIAGIIISSVALAVSLIGSFIYVMLWFSLIFMW